MKTLSFLFLVALTISLLPNQSTAQNKEVPPKIVHIEKGQQARTLTIQLANLLGARTEIFLLDGRGKSWFSKFIWGENGYHLLLDFEPLPEGDYLLQIANRYGRTVRAFNLQGPTLTFFEPSGRQVKKILTGYSARPEGRLVAQFEAAGPRLLNIRLANLRRQSATIDIVSLDGVPVFGADIREENGYGRSLNLDGMAPGYYYVYVRHEEEAILQFFHLRETGLELIPPLQMGDLIIAATNNPTGTN